ncbi:MAG TPA: hypothetical protein PK629_08270 [Oscillospiraceae bacterium]|nr:hypothetical protein [Oscillospiraceae bacterium]HPF56610.1 hypothetical protein [Clostridiales bacterium]HPK35454.1 hypothetical protein [Oscillospiraceae bacterium]HPR75178.1 hypothetical protein [Oscillospiraceae bacterium]
MSRALLASLGISLLLTLIFETGFFLLIGKRDKKDLLLLVMVNVVTNPLVVLLYWLTVLRWEVNSVIIIPLEVFAVLTEGCYYKKYGIKFKHPYLFSLAANAFSFGAGLLINWLI